MRVAGPLPVASVFVERLAAFARVHDRRGNVACHALSVPLLFLAAAVLLGMLRLHVAHQVLTLADAASIALAVAWIRLDARLGAATSLAALLVLLLGDHLASEGWVDALLAVVSFTVLGVGCELAGHAIEGSRPAVLTDRRAAIIAPLFLMASAAFAIGMRQNLAEDIDRRVRLSLEHPAPFEPLAGL